MKKTGLITSILLSICISSMAQDKSYLAKVEYEMAEEALAAKKYTEVNEHLNKAQVLLGASNFKLDYLRILNMFDLTQNLSENQDTKNMWTLALFSHTQKCLKDYSNTELKEQYAEVYRIQNKTEANAIKLKEEYIGWYSDYRSFTRTIDSLKYLKKTNWLEEKRGIDSIWTVGRTYDAIMAYYKNHIVKKINEIKQPVTDQSNSPIAYFYTGTYCRLTNGFTISNLNNYLPANAEAYFSGDAYLPSQAWFNESGRLFIIKYLRKNKTVKKFGPPVENTWFHYSNQWARYITASGIILEYFAYENETGLFVMLPYNKMEATDADGKNYNSKTQTLFEPTLIRNLAYFKNVYNYNSKINLGGIDSLGDKKGALINYILLGKNADQAGLTVNDIITRIGYRKIYSFSDLRTAVFLYSPGEVVELEYYRNEVPYTTKVVIDKSEN
jgi:hypothetical protein